MRPTLINSFSLTRFPSYTSTIFQLIIFPLVFTSCTHHYYVPIGQNVPLFKEKDEFRVSLARGGSGEASTTDLQAAYSLSDKFALMFNNMSANGEYEGDRGNGDHTEAAFGYYKPLGERGVFEVYSGFGGGSQKHRYSSNGSAELAFKRIFLQPSLGVTFSGFDIAFTTGISRIYFNRVKDQIINSGSDQNAIEAISQNPNSILFEPSITVRGGWKYLKLQYQYVHSSNLSHSLNGFSKEKNSFGLLFSVAERFDKGFQRNTFDE